MQPMMCDVCFKDEGVFIIPWTRDEKGGLMRCVREPIIRLGRAPSASELGEAARQALEVSGSPLPGPFGSYHQSTLRDNAIIRAAGLQSLSRLYSSSCTCSIESDGTRVEIRAGGAEVTCAPDAEEIGRGLLEVLRSCTPTDPISPARSGRSYGGPRREPAIDGGAPQSFGYKLLWIVVDTTDAAAVVSALGLRDVKPATWDDIDPYRVGDVFVSPSVLGWTFVLGLNTQPHYPDFLSLLEGLSRQIGEVQYFATHRVVELHAWAKAIDGRVVRAYGWIGERGEITIDVGERTPEEEELGFDRFLDSLTAQGDWGDLTTPDEEDVMHLAGKWSINPQELDAYESEGSGFLGRRP